MRCELRAIALIAWGASTCCGCGSRSDLSVGVEPELCGPSLGRDGAVVEFYLVVDRSTSMNCPIGAGGENCGLPGGPDPPIVPNPPDRWSAVAAALRDFVSKASSGVGIGIKFFPPEIIDFTGPCDPATYERPDVEIGPRASVSASIESALLAESPAGGTPTVPALRGAIAHARRRMTDDPARDASVLLLTDGIPNDCDSDTPTTVKAAKEGLTGVPLVRTYVVGVGPRLDALNEVAVAGGTAHAFLLATGADLSKEVTDALESISSCAGTDR
jgi:hypothetical protein